MIFPFTPESLFLQLHLMKGDRVVALWGDGKYLYAKTLLGRIFKSTEAPIEHLDMVEVT